MDFFCSYNLGNLTFEPPISLGIQVYAYSDVKNIKVKDFNQDEIPEIFFFDGLLSGTLYMAQKNTTTGAWTIEPKVNNVMAYNFIDSNNDGVDEIVSLSTTGSVRIHDQTGELLMTKQAQCYTMTDCVWQSPAKIFVNDVNADERPDITLLSRYNQHDFQSFLSNGTDYNAYTKIVDIETTLLGMGDIDGDHDIDIINGLNGISYYKNDGEGNFNVFESNHTDISTFDNYDNYVSKYIDVNGDQTKDFVTILDGYSLLIKTMNPNGSVAKTYIKTFEGSIMSYHFVDIDQDKDQDLLIVYYNEGISLSRNLGNMQFGEWEVLVSNCSACATVGVGDINNDQRPDIIVGGYWNIYIYQQTDSGNFYTTPQIIPHIAQYNQIDIIDLDQDGNKDILLAEENSHNLVWFKSNGQTIENNRRFITGFTYNLGAFIDIQPAYLGENILFTFASENRVVAVERQNGTFQSHVLFEHTDHIIQKIWIDVNHDSKKDLVVLDVFGKMILSIAQTDGTYGTHKSLIGQTMGYIFPATVDQYDAILVLSGEGKLTWHRIISYDVPLQENIITTNAENLIDFCTADLNQDGWNDIVTVSRFTNTIAYYQNQQNDTFAEARTTSTELDNLQSLTPIDIDQDGDIDIATASVDDNTIAYHLNDGQGTLSPSNIISQQVMGAKDLAAGDVDGDGKTDLVSISTTGNVVYWHKNLGNGNFDNQIITDRLVRPTTVVITDMDKDGLTDIVIVSETTNTIHLWEYKRATSVFIPIKNINVTQPQNIVMAELAKDFIAEILVASSQSGDVSYYIDNFIINTEPIPMQMVFSTLVNTKAICVADLDQDGQQDVVAGSYIDGIITWRRTGVQGSFNEPHSLTSDALGIKVLSAADLDNDGDDDVVAASVLDGKIRWFKNQSQKPTPYTPPTQTDSPLAGIYPNPTQDVIFINFIDDNFDGQYHCQLYTISGQLINAQVLSNIPELNYWSLKNLPAGLYFLRLTHENKSQVFRIVKR